MIKHRVLKWPLYIIQAQKSQINKIRAQKHPRKETKDEIGKGPLPSTALMANVNSFTNGTCC